MVQSYTSWQVTEVLSFIVLEKYVNNNIDIWSKVQIFISMYNIHIIFGK